VGDETVEIIGHILNVP